MDGIENRKHKIVEVDILSKHIYSYVICFLKLFLVFLYAVSIFLCSSVN